MYGGDFRHWNKSKIPNILNSFIHQRYIRRIAMLTREVFLISLVLSDRHCSGISGTVPR